MPYDDLETYPKYCSLKDFMKITVFSLLLTSPILGIGLIVQYNKTSKEQKQIESRIGNYAYATRVSYKDTYGKVLAIDNKTSPTTYIMLLVDNTEIHVPVNKIVN